MVVKLTLIVGEKAYTVVFWDYHKFKKGTALSILVADKDILDFFEVMFGGYYTIRQTDFTVDLFSHGNINLYTLISHTVFQKSSQKSIDALCDSSRYTRNVRKTNARACKTYLKFKKNDPEYEIRVRIENTYKNALLKKMNIHSLADLYNASAQDMFSNIGFKIFNVVNHNLYKKNIKTKTKRLGKNQYIMKHASITPDAHTF